jgi:hypothetical protein
MFFYRTHMAANVPASMWSLASCAGLKRLFMLAIVIAFFYSFNSIIRNRLVNPIYQ